MEARDSVYLRTGSVFTECTVDVPARLQNPNARINYTPQPMGASGGCYSAELKFVVGHDGIPETETARVVRSNPPAFGDAVLASLVQWRYSPATKDGNPVRQIVREKRAMTLAVVVAGSGVGARPPSPPRC
jgi:hypothetical protein